ncbi:hypothetical protein Mgra_00001466 [Meloidogyne graminicola]|uniref:Succinate dehydrogenase cytochrome b560 subunit, mitochondrial n=1 Tax=Meloidogyne graminicola TaxID=189291 RepID=A0A8T0A1G4_9BILA|nr:hypothetical protein Mgra_00001466 [Meloidogyne graminicola]
MLGRPVSPHLSIYKPQLTWLISGGHRITALFVGVLAFSYGPFSYSSFIERIRSWNLPWPITATFKFIIAWIVVFHSINGIRFMGFDLAKGMELRQIYMSGYLVLALSTLISILIVADSKRISANEIKEI